MGSSSTFFLSFLYATSCRASEAESERTLDGAVIDSCMGERRYERFFGFLQLGRFSCSRLSDNYRARAGGARFSESLFMYLAARASGVFIFDFFDVGPFSLDEVWAKTRGLWNFVSLVMSLEIFSLQSNCMKNL